MDPLEGRRTEESLNAQPGSLLLGLLSYLSPEWSVEQAPVVGSFLNSNIVLGFHPRKSGRTDPDPVDYWSGDLGH